jgi:hypothetical protein
MSQINVLEVCECTPPDKKEQEIANMEKGLSAALLQAAQNVPEFDPLAYKTFRTNVSRLAPQLPDMPLDASNLEVIREIQSEFTRYHNCSMNTIREGVAGWRELVAKLFICLLSRMGIDPASEDAAPLMQRISTLLRGEEIHAFLVLLDDFLRLNSVKRPVGRAAHKNAVDHSTTNDNAAGLLGGGAAVAQVRNIIEQGDSGFAVHFEMCCLSGIKEKFGVGAVQDCMMATSAFLTRSLRSEDTVFYWSDSSLMAILQSPVSEAIITSVIQRIVDNNRDITIRIGNRIAMLRIPLKFKITPISQLHNAAELYDLYE